MNPFGLVSLLTNARITGWRWSEPGKPAAPCLTGSCGVRDLTRLWVSFRFIREGFPCHLTAERDLTESAAIITLDGEALTGEMKVKKALKLSGLFLIVTVTPGDHEFRLEGRLRMKI